MSTLADFICTLADCCGVVFSFHVYARGLLWGNTTHAAARKIGFGISKVTHTLPVNAEVAPH